MLLLLGVLATSAWQRHSGVNCFAGSGGAEIDHTSAGEMTLDSCKSLCEHTSNCTGIVHKVAELQWTQHKDTNCYAGAGATGVPLPFEASASTCRSMTLDECETQCYYAEACTGVTWSTSDGTCCAISDINISACVSGGGVWDVHVLKRPVPVTQLGGCWRRSAIDIAHCDVQNEGLDTHVWYPRPAEPWWLTTNFVERSLMPRRFRCSEHSPPPGICTLRDLKALLPTLQASGYSVVNIDWPVWSGPDSLYEGFGIYNATAVDPLLGTDGDWKAFTDDAHKRGMRIVADFNPSYFYTGAPAFQQAVRDVAAHGVDALPAESPARWFRWASSCPGAKEQPPDSDPEDGFTDGWVHSSAASACYFSVFGGSDTYGGQPTADFSKSGHCDEFEPAFLTGPLAAQLIAPIPACVLAGPSGKVSSREFSLTGWWIV